MTYGQASKRGQPVGTTGRRERERAKRRQDILQAAREVFFGEGFSRATIDDVAARAEVSKGTVYLYFESKGAILAHLVLEGLGHPLRPPPDRLCPQERLDRRRACAPSGPGVPQILQNASPILSAC